VFYVGILEAGHLADAEAASRESGLTAYEIRTWCAGALPALIYQGSHEAIARARHEALSKHGYRTMLATEATLTKRREMIEVRHIDIGTDSLGAHGELGPRLPYAEIEQLIRIRIKTNTSRTIRELAQPNSRRRVPAEEEERTVRKQVSEQLLFVMPQGDALPWVISETETHYLGLGNAMQATAAQNFAFIINYLRASASESMYDARFSEQPIIATPMAVQGGARAELSRADVLVQMLRVALRLGGSAGPYR
jgi:hypothetical protein